MNYKQIFQDYEKLMNQRSKLMPVENRQVMKELLRLFPPSLEPASVWHKKKNGEKTKEQLQKQIQEKKRKLQESSIYNLTKKQERTQVLNRLKKDLADVQKKDKKQVLSHYLNQDQIHKEQHKKQLEKKKKDLENLAMEQQKRQAFQAIKHFLEVNPDIALQLDREGRNEEQMDEFQEQYKSQLIKAGQSLNQKRMVYSKKYFDQIQSKLNLWLENEINAVPQKKKFLNKLKGQKTTKQVLRTFLNDYFKNNQEKLNLIERYWEEEDLDRIREILHKIIMNYQPNEYNRKNWEDFLIKYFKNQRNTSFWKWIWAYLLSIFPRSPAPGSQQQIQMKKF